MKRLIKARHQLIPPIHRDRVLNQIVRPDTEKIHLRR